MSQNRAACQVPHEKPQRPNSAHGELSSGSERTTQIQLRKRPECGEVMWRGVAVQHPSYEISLVRFLEKRQMNLFIVESGGELWVRHEPGPVG
jgi:hypothetical protein